jgi:hypothetical protein
MQYPTQLKNEVEHQYRIPSPLLSASERTQDHITDYNKITIKLEINGIMSSVEMLSFRSSDFGNTSNKFQRHGAVGRSGFVYC